MKLLLLKLVLSLSIISSTFLSLPLYARDYGDRDCNIYVEFAMNSVMATSDPHYSIAVTVKKSLINQDFKNPKVSLQLPSRVIDQAHAKIRDLGHSISYRFRIPGGATYHSHGIDFIAFIDNGVDRLFDNNDTDGFLSLDRNNNWRHQSRCVEM